MRLTISVLAFILSLGLAVLAVPVDIDLVPSEYHLEFDRSPDLEWALERRGSRTPRIVVTMKAPRSEDLTKTQATKDHLNTIAANVQQLFVNAYPKLVGSRLPQFQVQWESTISYVPKQNVKLSFEAEVKRVSGDVCEGVCTGSVMSDSSIGWIVTGKGQPIYASV